MNIVFLNTIHERTKSERNDQRNLTDASRLLLILSFPRNQSKGDQDGWIVNFDLKCVVDFLSLSIPHSNWASPKFNRILELPPAKNKIPKAYHNLQSVLVVESPRKKITKRKPWFGQYLPILSDPTSNWRTTHHFRIFETRSSLSIVCNTYTSQLETHSKEWFRTQHRVDWKVDEPAQIGRVSWTWII